MNFHHDFGFLSADLKTLEPVVFVDSDVRVDIPTSLASQRESTMALDQLIFPVAHVSDAPQRGANMNGSAVRSR